MYLSSAISLLFSSLQAEVIPTPKALVSIDEREERDAQKALYSKTENELRKRRMKKLEFWKRVSTTYAPTFVFTFMAFYWIAGLRHAGVL